MFTRLDGGSVDLGVVRTKEDIQKNKFCEFSETFESVAYMGPQTAANAWAVRGTTPILLIGGYAEAIDDRRWRRHRTPVVPYPETSPQPASPGDLPSNSR